MCCNAKPLEMNLNVQLKLGIMTHIWNPTYLGGGDRRRIEGQCPLKQKA
jgi:hypothetical protein